MASSSSSMVLVLLLVSSMDGAVGGEGNIGYPFIGKYKVGGNESVRTIRLPSYGGELVVKSIWQERRKMEVADPERCVHRVFMELNLTQTPFRYYHVAKEWSYLNCSNALPSPFTPIPCMSGPHHHVYTVEPSLVGHVSRGGSCAVIRTLGIPFDYTPYLSAANTLGLQFVWDSPPQQNPHVLGLGVMCFILVAAIAVIGTAKLLGGCCSFRKGLCTEKQGRLLQTLPTV